MEKRYYLIISLAVISILMGLFMISNVFGMGEEYIEEINIIESFEGSNYIRKSISNESNLSEIKLQRKNYQGYIIEFEEPPLVVKKKVLDEEVEEIEEEIEALEEQEEIEISGFVVRDIERVQDLEVKIKKKKKENIKIFKEHKEKLKKEHKNALYDIRRKLGKEKSLTGGLINKVYQNWRVFLNLVGFSFSEESSEKSISGKAIFGPDLEPEQEFYNVFNGIALNISDEEAEILKQADYKVYPNLIVHTTLMDSVPLINADDVWKLDEDGNDCITSGKECLTGKGVSIAILDTGIDYTHEDLGGGDPGGGSSPVREPLISSPNTQRINPRMHGNIIVWEGRRKEDIYNKNIYMYNISSGIETQITNHRLYQGDPDIYGNIIVWEDYRYVDYNLPVGWGTENTSIFMYDISTGIETQVTNAEYYQAKPKIYGDIIVWEDHRNWIEVGGGWERNSVPDIYMYNISSGIETRVTPDTIGKYETDPEIYKNIIIWENYFPRSFSPDGITHEDVYIYNLSSGVITKITRDEGIKYYLGRGPSIYENIIIYNGHEGVQGKAGADLFMYDMSSGIKTQITNTDYYDFPGYVEKDKIAWYNSKLGNYNIQLYDLSAKKELEITCDQKGSLRPFIYKDIILWDADGDIYMLNLSSGEDICSGAEIYDFPTSKVIGGWNFVWNNEFPLDNNGHGTHVAGIVAGNGVIKGVAPDAKLYSYKVLSSTGSGSLSWAIGGIERAIDPNQDEDFSDSVDIISMSLGLDCVADIYEYSEDCGPDDPVSQAVDNAVDAGVVVVVAAGNVGNYGEKTITSPGTARKAITVGASYDKQQNDSSYNYTGYSSCFEPLHNPGINDVACFSSRGSVEYNGEIIEKPDIIAPGVEICSSQWGSAFETSSVIYTHSCIDTNHVATSGTSMAAPHIAGAVALLKQAHPDWTPEQIKNALKNTAIDLGLDSKIQGTGRVDVLEALNYNLDIEDCEIQGDEDDNGLADCMDGNCSEGTYCNKEHTKICQSKICLSIINCTDSDRDYYIKEITTIGNCENICGPSNNELCIGNKDCDDNDVSVWQDLDGYIDSDKDSYGGGSLLKVCSGENLINGYSNISGDCNDSNPNIHPGAIELCDNINNDCISDNDGKDESWYNEPTTCGVGACVSEGVLDCVNGKQVDSCVAGTPAPDDSNCNNLDDNCNGETDEDFVESVSNCGIGECSNTGLLQCISGELINTCTPGTPAPDDSTCDNKDNDCNGKVDEDYVSKETSCGVGECSGNKGLLNCISGVKQDTCNPFAGTIDESCEDETGYDKLDNNCDGKVDLDCEVYCDQDGDSYSSHLICLFGGYKLGDCDDSNVAINPGALELCDSIDNNCKDGIDENNGDCLGSYCVMGSCVECGNNVHCNDGLFCNGVENCVDNKCEVGVAPIIDDSVDCTIDSCNEELDLIIHTKDDSYCLDGLWCNGLESCDVLKDCQSGVSVSCNDSIDCTIDNCDEGVLGDNIGSCKYDASKCECKEDKDCNDYNSCTDDKCKKDLICENIVNDMNSCIDGFWCSVNDKCSKGSCIGEARGISDGVLCTIDSCDEENDKIIHLPDDSLCSNGKKCDLLKDCILQTCSEQNGYICSEDEYCPGNSLVSSDAKKCCDVSCEKPAFDSCLKCGDGLFNICSRLECQSILEGCYFINNLNQIGGSCRSCSEASCKNYNSDKLTCYLDFCSFENCEWTGRECVEAKGPEKCPEYGDKELPDCVEVNCLAGVLRFIFNDSICNDNEVCTIDRCTKIGCKYTIDENNSECLSKKEKCLDNDKDGLLDYDSVLCSIGVDKCVENFNDFTEFKKNQLKPISRRLNISFNENEDIRNLTMFKIFKKHKAEIEFKERLRLVKFNKTGCFAPIHLDTLVEIEDKKVKVYSDEYLELNKSAQIKFYNVGFVEPKIKKDGVDCIEPECKIIEYNKTGDYVIVEVQGFSEYEIVEGFVEEPGGGLSTSNDGGGGSGGGSGSIGTTAGKIEEVEIIKECFENWICEDWVECIDGKQTRVCEDKNTCGTKKEIPKIEKECEVPATIKDKDIWKRYSKIIIIFISLGVVVLVVILLIQTNKSYKQLNILKKGKKIKEIRKESLKA